MGQVIQMHRRMSGLREDRKSGERRPNAGKIKLQQKQKKAKSPKEATRSHYNCLSFRSGGEGKEYVRRIDQDGKGLRGATDRSDLPFPKVTVQWEAEGGSEVGWRIQAVGVPTVL
jgi:hypothetical protein